MIKKIISLLLSAAFCITFAACGKKEDAPTVVYYSFEDYVSCFDPSLAKTDDEFLVIENIFEGLLRFDDSNTLYSEICEDYYTSDDGLVYTFILKDNLLWSDRTPLTSDDFRFAVERALDKNAEAPYANYLFSIVNAKSFYNGECKASQLGIQTVNNRTISFILSEKDPNFLSSLASPVMMPCNRAFFAKTKGKYGRETEMLLTNGPFSVTESSEEEIILSKNEGYISRETIVPDKIYIYQNTDAETKRSLFEDKSLDIINFDSEDYNTFNSDKYTISSYSNITYGILFNLNDEIGGNSDFRKMISLCVDIDTLSSSFPDRFTRAEGIVPPSCYCSNKAYRQLTSPVAFEYNEEKAKDAYKKFVSGIKESMPKLTIIYSDSDELKELVTNFVYSYQKNFSIFINPKPLSEDEFDSAIESGDYQLAFTSLVSNDISPVEILSNFKSDAENPCGFKEKEYDALFKSIPNTNTDDSAKYIKLCEEYIIKTKKVFLPVAYTSTYYALQKSVTQFVVRPAGGKIDFRFIQKKD